MNKLRLLVTKNCDRQCPGCCNKDWDLDGLPTIDTNDFEKYDEILITGGEPLLYPKQLIPFIERLRKRTNAKIFVYTARTKKPIPFIQVLSIVDGITLTLHEQSDVLNFKVVNDAIDGLYLDKSLRLNIFKDIKLFNIKLDMWKVKDNIEWIKDCPLPVNEVFGKFLLTD